MNSSFKQSSNECAQNNVSAPIIGLVVGLLIDIGGSILIASIIYSFYAIANGIPHETIIKIKSISEYLSKPHMVISSIIGCLLSVLAGFVCSRIARSATMKLAHIMAAISFITGFALSYSTYPISLVIIFSVTLYALLIIGYGLGQQVNNSR